MFDRAILWSFRQYNSFGIARLSNLELVFPVSSTLGDSRGLSRSLKLSRICPSFIFHIILFMTTVFVPLPAFQP